MANGARQIEDSLNRMQRLGKKLRLLFTVLLVLICICSAVVAVMVLGKISNGLIVDSSHTVSVVVPLAYLIICGMAALTLRGISGDMAEGESPFTFAHARRIGALGWMFVAVAIIEVITSPGFVAIALGPFFFVSAPQEMIEGLTIPLDMGAILCAVTCFSLSAIWRYGTLLQAQAEDLV